MIDLKNMITKQQKFIDDNDIVGKHDGSKYLWDLAGEWQRGLSVSSNLFFGIDPRFFF